MRAEDGRQQIVDARVLVGERGLDRRLDLGRDVAEDRGDALVVELSGLAQERLEPRQRILRLPLVDHRRVPHVGKIRPHRVLHPAERLHLEERGPVPGASERERPGDCVLDGQEIVAVDDLAGHPVPGGPVREILDRP